MPIHDWTRVEAGLFHAFHQRWISALCDALNGGRLPPGCYALPEQVIAGPIPDVVTLTSLSTLDGIRDGGVAVVDPPRTSIVQRGNVSRLAQRGSRVVIRHTHGKVLAVIEIVSPGNKASQHGLLSLTRKLTELVTQGIHVLLIDIHPPTPRDPEGLHAVFWGELTGERFTLPPDRRLVLASYQGTAEPVAYVELVTVGEALPDMPLFLTEEAHILVPLEATYQATWSVFPDPLKGLLA